MSTHRRTPRPGLQAQMPRWTRCSLAPAAGADELLRQLPEQRLGLYEVLSVEALAEPLVYWLQAIKRFAPLPVVAPKAREARRSAQLPRLCFLRTRKSERRKVVSFCSIRVIA